MIQVIFVCQAKGLLNSVRHTFLIGEIGPVDRVSNLDPKMDYLASRHFSICSWMLKKMLDLFINVSRFFQTEQRQMDQL